MQLQLVTLIYPDEVDTVFVDIAGSEEADDSLFMLSEHKQDGFKGTLSYGKFVENSSK